MKSLLAAVLPSFFFVNAFTQINLNQGLIAYYPFNGNGNDAYYFDGIDDQITIPGNAGMNTANAMSICMYFNPESTSLQTLIGKISYGAGNGTQFQIALNFNLFPGVLFGVNNPADDC